MSDFQRRLILVLIFIASISACSDDPVTEDTSGIDFPNGDFDISTTLVDDQCLDGGLNLLFMPNGQDEPWLWPYPIQMHGQSALPKTYDIQLREPFGTMTVAVTNEGGPIQRFEGERKIGVLLGAQNFGECVVDMDVVVEVKLLDSDSVEGAGVVQMTNPRGDERCPVDMPATCEVVLTFSGTRLGN